MNPDLALLVAAWVDLVFLIYFSPAIGHICESGWRLRGAFAQRFAQKWPGICKTVSLVSLCRCVCTALQLDHSRQQMKEPLESYHSLWVRSTP